jgi:hypothetical protein
MSRGRSRTLMRISAHPARYVHLSLSFSFRFLRAHIFFLVKSTTPSTNKKKKKLKKTGTLDGPLSPRELQVDLEPFSFPDSSISLLVLAFPLVFFSCPFLLLCFLRLQDLLLLFVFIETCFHAPGYIFASAHTHTHTHTHTHIHTHGCL